MNPAQDHLTLRQKLTRTALVVLVLLTSFLIPFTYTFFSANDGYGLAANRPAPDFTLKDAQGTEVSLRDLQGKHIFLMFGYMNCRDICHSQALIFQEINKLADMDNRLRFLYITMDPGRDSAEQLAAYFDQRSDNFTSLRSENIGYLQEVAGAYRAFFAKGANLPAGDYEVEHPGLYFLIGPDGKLRYIYTASQTRSDLIVEDLKKIKNEYAAS